MVDHGIITTFLPGFTRWGSRLGAPVLPLGKTLPPLKAASLACLSQFHCVGMLSAFMFLPAAKAMNLVARGGIERGRRVHRYEDFQSDWPTFENR